MKFRGVVCAGWPKHLNISHWAGTGKLHSYAPVPIQRSIQRLSNVGDDKQHGESQYPRILEKQARKLCEMLNRSMVEPRPSI